MFALTKTLIARPTARLNPKRVSYGNRRCIVNLRVVRASSAASDPVEVEDARGAISVGLEMYKEGKYEEAMKMFEKALMLPGTGTKRFRDKPREISAGEKQAALFNIACCFSRLGDARSGLITLATCLEAGYEEFDVVRSDPDLETLRKDERFENVMSKFEPNPNKGGIFGMLQYQLDPKNSALVKAMNKPKN